MAEAHQRIVPFKQMTSKRTVMADEDDKDEDDLPVRRRRMPAKRRLPRRFSSSEDEVRAELKNLKKVRTNLPKRRERPQKNQFARNLEKLKRARLGLSPIQSSDSSSAGDSDRGGDDEDEDGDDGKLEDTIQNSSDQDDTSFIVEDPEDDEDDLNQIPDEFRLSTHQNLETDFKVYVQYLLNLSFDQDFERNHANDKYFRHSINHVIRTLGSYQTSMTVSQKWSHDFKRQLDSRPHYSKRRSSGLMRPCDACQISNRPATFVGILSGAKYNMPKSLRDMSYFDEDLEESTSDEEEGEEEEDNDKSFKFYLGKYCCQRSFVYHQLRHWNFHCATKIEQEAEEIQERERSKQKTKHQSSLDIDTNFLQDKLEASGFVDQLWKQLKAILTGARDLESSKDF
ncbi:hypothetical protein BGZ83_003936 [Gryganskiella cystojenkinii]|nr:hypothetical protein BGZ83_003936 [Gryganskiella cystojenkinii]